MSVSNEADAPHVVLVGLSGAGKSTVAHVLSDMLGRTRADIDALIAARSGLTTSDLLRHDPIGFRRIEAEVIAEVLGDPTPHVVATGGGAVTTPATRDRLIAGIAGHPPPAVVWLRAPTTTLAARVKVGEERPLLAGAAMVERLEAQSQERDELYAAVATFTLDTATMTPYECAHAIAAWLSTSSGK